jgi:hypothetical protein
LTPSTTVFYIALKPDDLNALEESEFRQWEDIARGGGRLVLSFQPSSAQSAIPDPVPLKDPDGETDKTENAGELGPRDPPRRTEDARGLKSSNSASPIQRWGFHVAYQELPASDETAPAG